MVSLCKPDERQERQQFSLSKMVCWATARCGCFVFVFVMTAVPNTIAALVLASTP
ncbi:MAG: hypothetical protein KME42_26010 [Tildeniella nuda ZEHNDER 1965/U140]|nr:hypothetical protein [Tildeniella nuda ZEHNDER 1965/U140]